MNSKIITVVKRTTSALIIALSLVAICIPAVAVNIAHKPNSAAYSYYRVAPFGGNSYSSIKQGVVNSNGILYEGSSNYISNNSGGKIKFDNAIKIETHAAMPKDIVSRSTDLKFTFYKKDTSSLKWYTFSLKDVTGKSYSTYTVYKNASISKYKSSSTYNTQYLYANLPSGNYQFHVTTSEIPPIYSDYVNIYFQSDLYKN